MKKNLSVLFGTFAVAQILGYAPFAHAQSTKAGPEGFPEIITLTPDGGTPVIASSTVKRYDVASFVAQTMREHPAILAAKATLRAEQARARGMERGLYNPELELDFETADTETTTIGLSQTLDRHGKRKARAVVGRENVIAAQATLALVEKTLEAQLLDALADYQVNLDIVELSEKRVAFSREFLKLAKRREAAGDLSLTDVLTAELALSGSSADLASAKADLSKATQKLITLTGIENRSWPRLRGTPSLDIARGIEPNPDELPEIRLALAQSRAMRSKIGMAAKMRKTDPTVGGRIGAEGSNVLFGVSLSIPLQINNNFSDSVDVAKAESQRADAGVLRVKRQTISRLNGTRRRFEASQQAWQDWQKTGAAQLDKQRALLKRLWEAGELGASEYLISYNQTFEAEVSSMELKAAYWRNWFAYLDASNSIPTWLEAIK